MHLRTVVGVVELEVWHGEDPREGHWGSPMRERWGLKAHQQMSPALEDKLAFTATVTPSYSQASALAAKWDCPVAPAVIHALAQRLGRRAEEQTQARLQTRPQESQPQRAAAELAVVMIDGWLARFRGGGWGKKKTRQKRVEWHEIKTGIFYRAEQAGQTEGGRGAICQKVVVRWQGEPLELGRRLHWESLRGGLGRAQAVQALGDGSAWIWNLVSERWPEAVQTLDFYHASEHVWALGRACHGEASPLTQEWVEAPLHRLRHGQEKQVLKEIAALKARRGPRGQIVRKEQNYFAGQQERMNYQELAKRGWPIGSGAVESTCRQSQGRFKGAGQFWTPVGFRHLSALDEARHNGHWDELWTTA